jgi:hypothetical protein
MSSTLFILSPAAALSLISKSLRNHNLSRQRRPFNITLIFHAASSFQTQCRPSFPTQHLLFSSLNIASLFSVNIASSFHQRVLNIVHIIIILLSRLNSNGLPGLSCLHLTPVYLVYIHLI